jgi:predicted transcriptional regulator
MQYANLNSRKLIIFVEKEIIMGTLELKSELIRLIEKIEDSKVLGAIYILLTKQAGIEKEVDFWDELPEEVRNDIDEAIAECERGEGIPHKEAMKQIREKIASL